MTTQKLKHMTPEQLAAYQEKQSRKVTVYGRNFFIFLVEGIYHVKFEPTPEVRAALRIKSVFKSTKQTRKEPARVQAEIIIKDYFADPMDPQGTIPILGKKAAAAVEPFPLLSVFIDRYVRLAHTVEGRKTIRKRTISDNVAQLKQVLERRFDPTTGKELPRKIGEWAKMTIDQVLDPKIWKAFMNGWLNTLPAGSNAKLVMRRTVSVNATVAHAISMFGEDYLPIYEGLRIPDVVEFRKQVKFFKEDREYFEFKPIATQTIDALEAEIRSLRTRRPDLYLGYFLAIRGGMRRGEIAAARREWLETWTTGEPVVAIEPRDYFTPKRSSRRFGIDPWLLSEVLELGGSKQPMDFLIPGNPDGVETSDVDYRSSRGDSATSRMRAMKYDLSRIIRKHLGNARSKTLHELRKQAGSNVAAIHGREAAARFLGHKDQRTSDRFYLGNITAPPVLYSSKVEIRALPDPKVDHARAAG